MSRLVSKTFFLTLPLSLLSSGAFALSRPYMAELRIPVSAAESKATATIHVDINCRKKGIGVPFKPGICDGDRGVSLSKEFKDLPVSLRNNIFMTLVYAEDTVGKKYSRIDLGPIKGTIGALRFTTPEIPDLGEVTLSQIQLGSVDPGWTARAQHLTTLGGDDFSLIDGTLQSYPLIFSGPVPPQMGIHAQAVSENYADRPFPIQKSLGAMVGKNPGFQATLSEGGVDPVTGKGLFRLTGTINIPGNSETREYTTAGSGLVISLATTVTLSFNLTGTSSNPIPTPDYRITIDPVGLVGNIDGLNIGANKVAQAQDERPGGGRKENFTAKIYWGGVDNLETDATLNNDEFFNLLVSGGRPPYTAYTALELNNHFHFPYVSQAYVHAKVVLTQNDGRSAEGHFTVIGPKLVGESAVISPVSLKERLNSVIGFFTDTAKNRSIENYEVAVDYGDGKREVCNTKDATCDAHLVGVRYEIISSHTYATVPFESQGQCGSVITITVKASDNRVVESYSYVPLVCPDPPKE